MPSFDYATVGHVTIDVFEDGGRRPGGAALYSALQASRLGLRTLIVTQGVRSEIESLLAPHLGELDLLVLPAPATTTLRTVRTVGTSEHRRQSVEVWAGQMRTIPPLEAGIVHLAPVARETPPGWRPEAGFVCITPQGLIRSWPREGGAVTATPLDPADLPGRFDAAAINASELNVCAALPAAAEASGAALAITASSAQTRVLCATGELTVPAIPVASPVDDIGAGDVFAAAFFVALAGGDTVERAASLGNAAAALRISGLGPDAIGDAAAIAALSETRKRSARDDRAHQARSPHAPRRR